MKKGSTRHKPTETMRWCFVCKQYKPFSDFHIDRAQAGGLSSACKSCKGKYDKEYQHNYYMKYRKELLPKHRITARESREYRKNYHQDTKE